MAGMSFDKYIIGSGILLDWAMAAWAQASPHEQLHPVDIGQDMHHHFDLSALDSVAPQDATAFVAWGPQFLNFRRLELMGELKVRGFRLPPLACSGSIVAANVTLAENCTVSAGAVVGAGCKIGFNTFIGAGCILGPGVVIGASAWIADGVQIGMQAKVGSNATLGRGVILADGVSIGKQSVLDIPGRRTEALPDKTFVLPAFSGVVSIIDGGAKP